MIPSTYLGIVWFCITLTDIAHCIHIEVVSLLPVDATIAPGLAWTGAALTLATQRTSTVYAEQNITVAVQQVRGALPLDCAQLAASSAALLGEYYYRHVDDSRWDDPVCHVVIAIACNDFPTISNLVREWDWLVINNGLGQSELINTKWYPNSLTMGATYDSQVNALFSLLRYFKWKHVTVLLDTEATTIIYGMINKAIRRLAATTTFNDTLETVTFKGSSQQTMVQSLDIARKRSRVFIFLTAASTVLTVRKLAGKSGMNNGEYVFINIQPVQASSYGRAAYFNNFIDTDLLLAQWTFFLVISTANSAPPSLNEELAQISRSQYNTKFDTGDQPMDSYTIRATYEIVEMLPVLAMQTLNRSGGAQCSGSAMATAAFGQRFRLTSGNIALTEQGVKLVNVDVFSFHNDRHSMQLSGHFDAGSDELQWLANMSFPWIGGAVPLDIPLCGFLGTEGPCQYNGPAYSSIVIPAIAGMLILCMSVFFIRHWINMAARKSLGFWWLLNISDLEMRLDLTKFTHGTINWNQRLVWAQRIPLQRSNGKQALHMEKLSKIIPILEHQCIHKFYGLIIDMDDALMVSDYCQKGNILTLFDMMQMDKEFQFSLIMDIIQGVAYLHSTLQDAHGFLKPTHCLIDQRFTLKIAKFRYRDIVRHLANNDLLIEQPDTLWMAPEHRSNPKLHRSRSGDIYSIGLLILTILQQHAPDFAEMTFQTNTIAEMDTLIKTCTKRDPRKRPTIQALATRLQRVQNRHGISHGNIVERTITKFSAYVVTLEAAVTLRTQELNHERAKCDTLLMEMLPLFVVEQLRNRSAVIAKTFASVSVYFGELDGFASWAAQTDVKQALKILTRLCTVLDEGISEFNVLKVENIRDSYLVVGGIPVQESAEAHAITVCEMALALPAVLVAKPLNPQFLLRAGIHSGPCAAGVIGLKVPRYCLFGDTVNMASRMATYGDAGKVHLTEDTASLTAGYPPLTSCERGWLDVRGKGRVRTFWLYRHEKESDIVVSSIE
ncbi:atrial natriuretic peptide receptor 1-like [Paramacrobiotus metropolitanus]|uniref:atrial natriuretic peptide receptor 1-like n=1 Tax=Paramacrobiotus metropolitanus TaxID=2943436 RepID=UPI0024457571|nr:atrial natriuretic peptide receptor 1-like [Paramacrobiotus metropolitanus]